MSHMARRLFLPSLLLPLAWLAAGASSALAQSPSPSLAQPAAAPAAGTTPARPSPELVAPPPPPTRGVRSEPAVQRSVIEDDNARIEELRVRGAVRSTVVKPKGPITREYEVIPADAGRDITEGPNSSKGNAGQRVWRVMTF